MNRTHNTLINDNQLWKLFTHELRQSCKAQGYITFARLVHNIPYLFFVDKIKVDKIKETFYARPMVDVADYVIEGRWDIENQVYLFCLTKERYPWEYLEKTSRSLVYDPAEYAEEVMLSLNLR